MNTQHAKQARPARTIAYIFPFEAGHRNVYYEGISLRHNAWWIHLEKLHAGDIFNRQAAYFGSSYRKVVPKKHTRVHVPEQLKMTLKCSLYT